MSLAGRMYADYVLQLYKVRDWSREISFLWITTNTSLGINTYLTTFSVDVAEAYYFSLPMCYVVGLFSHNQFRHATVKAHAEACFR